MKDTALLIIDIQNDYFPGGKMELDGATEAAEKASDMLTFFRGKNLPVFHVQHESVGEGSTLFLPGQKKLSRLNMLSENVFGFIELKKAFNNTHRIDDLFL